MLAENGEVSIATTYSLYSNATGALFNFLHLNDSESIDFTESFHFALQRNNSNITIPYHLNSGVYIINVYDIESDGTLRNGLGYPAATAEFISSHASEGSHYTSRKCIMYFNF